MAHVAIDPNIPEEEDEQQPAKLPLPSVGASTRAGVGALTARSLHVDVGESNRVSPRIEERVGVLVTAPASTSAPTAVPVRRKSGQQHAGRRGDSNANVKLPALVKANRYGLGPMAVKAMRDAQYTGTLPPATAHHSAAAIPPYSHSHSQMPGTAASATTTGPAGFPDSRAVSAWSSGMKTSPFGGIMAGLMTRSPSPGAVPSSVPSSAASRQRSPGGPGRNLPSAAGAATAAAAQGGAAAGEAEGGAGAGAGAGGEELEGDDTVPTLYLDDDDELTERLLSLPNIMCHAANGDVFLVGLGDVQNMLHKRRLGPKGLMVLRRFENATMAQWDVGREKTNDQYVLKWRQKHEQRLADAAGHRTSTDGASPIPGINSPTRANRVGRAGVAVGAAVDASIAQTMNSLGMGGLGLSLELEAEVTAHLEESMAAVEKHREYLQAHSVRALAEVARVEADEAAARRKTAAVDFVVKHLIPEKILAMANTRRTKAAGNGLFKKMKASITPEPNGQAKPEGEEEEVTPRDGVTKSGKGNWGKLKTRTDDVLANMPFMDGWNTAITKLRRDEKGAGGWDDLLVANSVYVKGSGGDNQGAAVYVYQCQQLGVTACTQVVQQLRCPEANMAHCKLGRRGAQALRHALATNTAITSLDLSDNALDAQGCAEIINGLTSGTMALSGHKTRKVLQDKWKHLDWVKAYQHPVNDAAVLQVPEALRKAAEKQAAKGGTGEHESAGEDNDSPGSRSRSPSPPRSPQRTGSPSLKDGSGSPAREGGKAKHEMKGRKTGAASMPTMKQAGGGSIFTSILSRVQILDLSGNLLGVNGAKVIANLLNPTITGHQFLTELRLNKCGIPEAGGMAIFAAMVNGNNTLATLALSNNSCGNAAARVLGELLKVNIGLHELDMSWNQIKPEGVQELCTGLDENITLQKLNLAWNGLEDQGVVRLGQMLALNQGLKHLDLTNTRMGAEACLMLGEGIKANSCLEDLILNGNAVGDDGARHLMSALKANNTLQYLGLQGSNMSSAARGQSSASDFNPLAPDGSYSLTLSTPADRAVALQLCNLEVNGKGDMMRNVRMEGRSITSVKGMHWPEQLPVSGMLTFDFVSRRAQKTLQVMDHKKFQALVGQLDSHAMSDKEKGSLVDVMAPFTYFYCHQIAQVLKCFTMGDELVRSAALLFTRAADLEESIEKMTSAMQERDIHALHQQLGWYSYYRFSNPSGHYELNLTTHVEQALATRLKDVAFSEPSDGNNWHNIIHDLYSSTVKVPNNYGPPEQWKGNVPVRGTLAFDFVSTVVPPEDAQPIGDDQLLDFLHHGIGILFNESGVPLPEHDFAEADLQIALLRQEVGHQFFFTCAQLIRVMSCFLAGPHKVEVAVMLYALLTDRKDFWRVMYSLRSFEQALLMWRLGPSQVFDRSHPSGHYVLDLNNHNHEQVARKLVELASQNNDVPNFWNIRLQGNKKTMVENRNMWGAFTAETVSPFLEFDFIGPDAPDCLLNKNKADWEAGAKGDRLDGVTKLAKRMEMQRIKDMYGYFWDGSGWNCPAWRSAAQLFKPLLNKAPWLAAYDRLMRLLFRHDQRSGDITTDSYIEDIFDNHCSEEGELSSESFEALCKEWGYTRSEMFFHYRPLFESASRPSAEAAAAATSGGGAAGGDYGAPSPMPGSLSGVAHLTAEDKEHRRPSASGNAAPAGPPEPAVPMVVDFQAFADVFMREPLPEMRWKEVPTANLMAVAAAARALKGLRKGLPGGKK